MHSNGTHLNRARRLPSKYPLHASYTGSTSASHLNWNTKTSIELSSLCNACYPWTCYARDFHRVSCSRITRAPFNIFIFQVTCLYGASISMEDWTEIGGPVTKLLSREIRVINARLRHFRRNSETCSGRGGSSFFVSVLGRWSMEIWTLFGRFEGWILHGIEKNVQNKARLVILST